MVKGFTKLCPVCNSTRMAEAIPLHSDTPTIGTRLHFSATVLLEKRKVQRKFWHSHSWYLDTVAIGDAVCKAAKGGELAYTKSTGDVFRWSGFQVTLYKDACERYWHALISDEPKIYVVCRDSDAECEPHDVTPLCITLDYDEALAFAETDDLTLSAPIPPQLYRYMEDFVLAHYRPVPFKKRKRRNWSKEAESAQNRRNFEGKGFR